MNYQRGSTITDIIVAAVCVALVLVTLGAAGRQGRERAKRAVCLGNLKSLTQAWRQFADDHDGNLVNGAAGMYSPDGAPWVGRCWADDWPSGGQAAEDEQHREIREGALWPYVEDLRVYRCPNGYTGERLNYGISDGMNGLSRTGTTTWVDGKVQGVRVGDTVVWVQNLSEIISPGPAERMVFIDRGWIAPDSYSTHYRWEAWWDDPPVRHNNGATVSFADGHAEYWQWKGADTVEHGWRSDRGHFSNNYAPQTAEGREDLHRLQRAVWGRLGYEPTD